MLSPETLFSSCSDNSASFTSCTSCFASCSIFSIFLLSWLMVFLLFENVSFVNSGAPLKHPNQLPSPYKVQTNEKRGQNSFTGEQSIHEAQPQQRAPGRTQEVPRPRQSQSGRRIFLSNAV